MQRTAPDQCESCNPGYALSGAKCKPFKCEVGPGAACGLAHVQKADLLLSRLDYDTMSIMHCLGKRADPKPC